MNPLEKRSLLRYLLLLALGIVLVLIPPLLPVLSQETGRAFVVATEPTFPPFEMTDEQTGQLTGFDIDLIQAMGDAAGLNVQIESLPFDGIIPALQSGTIQAAISGITITGERAQSVAFSSPYFKAGLAIAVQENNDSIKSLADLAGKKLAVQIGTTGAMEATKIPGAQVVNFDSAAIALQELVNGKVDAVINDGPVTLFAIKEAGLKGVKIAGEAVTEEFYGIALPLGTPGQPNEDLALVNYGLFQVIASGTYKALYEKWFGAEPPFLPLVAPAMVGTQASLQTTQTGTGESFYGRLFKNLIRGAGITVLLTAFAVFFGLLGGTAIALALISPIKALQWLCRIYVEFFRGTPMLVQLFIIYFGLPALFKGLGLEWTLDRFPAAVLALSLNVAAYLAEIIRGGIQSVEQGQWEACQSLGMTPWQTLQDIIFPQAFRRILPPLGNEFITLIKDTSLTAVIGFNELFREGQLVVATTYKAFEVYVAVALVYLVLTTLSSFAFKALESRMDPVGRAKKLAAKLSPT
ncbi:MAG: Gln/Arg/Lys/His-binding protein and permease protein [Cyanobacteriota bacterium]|jgi:arginine/lysine/histidine/glutamine transport system substrate-binding/permease protein